MPPTLGPIVSYNSERVIQVPVGATALRAGDLCKLSAGTMIPLASGDHTGQYFVSLGYNAASATNGAFVPLADCKIRIAYTGTPTLGASYGVTDQRTLAAADTTNLLLVVTKLAGDLDAGFVEAIEAQVRS